MEPIGSDERHSVLHLVKNDHQEEWLSATSFCSLCSPPGGSLLYCPRGPAEQWLLSNQSSQLDVPSEVSTFESMYALSTSFDSLMCSRNNPITGVIMCCPRWHMAVAKMKPVKCRSGEEYSIKTVLLTVIDFACPCETMMIYSLRITSGSLARALPPCWPFSSFCTFLQCIHSTVLFPLLNYISQQNVALIALLYETISQIQPKHFNHLDLYFI